MMPETIRHTWSAVLAPRSHLHAHLLPSHECLHMQSPIACQGILASEHVCCNMWDRTQGQSRRVLRSAARTHASLRGTVRDSSVKSLTHEQRQRACPGQQWQLPGPRSMNLWHSFAVEQLRRMMKLSSNTHRPSMPNAVVTCIC